MPERAHEGAPGRAKHPARVHRINADLQDFSRLWTEERDAREGGLTSAIAGW